MQYKWRVKKSERRMSLENFIYRQLGDWSHKQVKTAIDHKRAFVNGRNVFISKWNLKPNDLVLFAPVQKEAQPAPGSRYRFIEVLFEDNYLLVTNKPPFIDFEAYVCTVQDYLRRKNREKSYPYLGQMHRLDKETSGVMIFTKKKMANVLADQFRGHTIKKFYLAIVQGRVMKDEGKIAKAIQKGEFGEGRKVRIAGQRSQGMHATTLYRVKERYEKATLLAVEILTGRTHQIRIHLSGMGHPLVGDKLYGHSGGFDFHRQALHAERLDFVHPVTHKRMKIVAPLPPDMRQLIETLREEA